MVEVSGGLGNLVKFEAKVMGVAESLHFISIFQCPALILNRRNTC
jgi:hypothetical protein